MTEPMTAEEIARVQSRVDYATELSRPELLSLLGDAGEAIDTLSEDVKRAERERDEWRHLHEKNVAIATTWMEKCGDAEQRAEAAEAERDEYKIYAENCHNVENSLLARAEAVEELAEWRRRILRVIEGDDHPGTCDWGDCDREADGWREDQTGQFEWLPVCDRHTASYEAAEADNAALWELAVEVVDKYEDATRYTHPVIVSRYRHVLGEDHPGAAILARLAVLERVYEAAKKPCDCLGGGRDSHRDPSCHLIAALDAVQKVGR